MRISYLSVGDELLDGRVTDSNLTFTGGAIRRETVFVNILLRNASGKHDPTKAFLLQKIRK